MAHFGGSSWVVDKVCYEEKVKLVIGLDYLTHSKGTKPYKITNLAVQELSCLSTLLYESKNKFLATQKS